MVSSLLLGVHLDVALTPPDAPADQVTHVALSGTDASGAFAHLDPAGRRAASTAALIAMGQLFPKATIDLAVVDDGGHPLLSASKAPGAEPTIQPAS
jgi:hypothetical protein